MAVAKPAPTNLQALTDATATRVAQQYGIDPQTLQQIFHAQINQESGFNPTVNSGAGAEGIAQIVPKYHPGVDPYNPSQALTYAATMDAKNFKKYGDWNDVLSVYNSGQPWAKGQGISETNNYVKSILGASKQGTVSPSAVSALQGTTQTALGAPAGSDSRTALLSYLQGQLANYSTTGQATNAQGLAQLQTALSQPKAQTVATTSNGLKVQTDHDQPLSPNAAPIVKAAEKYLGTPYQWGGTTPKGFDCSGFVQYIYSHAGIQLPRTSQQQATVGQPVDPNNLQAGDLLFFNTEGKDTHEGMYIGNGQFIQAPHTGDVVKISSLSDPYYSKVFAGARRVTGGTNASK